MTIRDYLTSEKIKKYFKNNFELANYAILMVRHMVRSGKEVHLDQFLDDIAKNPHKYHAEDFKDHSSKEELDILLDIKR